MGGMDVASPRTTPTKRVGLFILVVCLHAMIVYALATGPARKVADTVQQTVEVRLIETARPTPPEAPPARPQLRPRKQAPRVRVARAPALSTQKPARWPEAPVVVTNPAPSPLPAPPMPVPEQVVAAPAVLVETTPAPHLPVRTAPVVDSRYCKKPEYPSASIRREETGVVVLNFLIDVEGHVVQSKVESSSGYDRLDEAARETLSLCRFKPGTVDGKPEKSWNKLRYVWELKE